MGTQFQPTCPHGDTGASSGLSAGDTTLLTKLLSSSQGGLERRIRGRLDRRLTPRLDETDVLQEAYVEALRRLAADGARPALPLSRWFWSIAQQKMVDLYRFHLGARCRDPRRETREGGDDSSPLGSLSAWLRDPSDQNSPIDTVLREELALHVRTALRSLSARDQEVLMLRHTRDLSFAEVAAVLGVSLATAIKRYHRALQRCRRRLLRLPGTLLEPWMSSS